MADRKIEELESRISQLVSQTQDLNDELEEKSELVVDLKSKARKDQKLHDSQI